MAARGAREDGGRGSQTRIVELGAGMPVNERKKGAHGLFEAPPPSPCVYSPLCTRALLAATFVRLFNPFVIYLNHRLSLPGPVSLHESYSHLKMRFRVFLETIVFVNILKGRSWEYKTLICI